MSTQPADIQLFATTLTNRIRERYGKKPLSRSHVRPIQTFLDREWADFCRFDPCPYILAEGCAVTGLRLAAHHGEIMFQWGTAFYPRPRYPGPEQSVFALGFSGPYDLYLTGQGTDAPQLVARHGSGLEAAVWDFTLPHREPPLQQARELREGLRRARLANALWGTSFARPAPLGSIAMPDKVLSALEPVL